MKEEREKAEEYFLTIGEIDYCKYMLYECIKELNKNQHNLSTSPLEQLVDNVVRVNKVDWKKVANTIYWCNQVSIRCNKLKMEVKQLPEQILSEKLKEFMIKHDKEYILNEVLEEINQQQDEK